MGSETNEIIEDLFESFWQNYQEGLEESMRGSEFAYDSVDALYYNLNKVSLSRGGSYIDSPKWLKNKNATINPKNKDDKCFLILELELKRTWRHVLVLSSQRSLVRTAADDDLNKCFQYALTVALNYEKIKKDPQIISNIKPFIDQYDWKDIDFPSHDKDWKKFEPNNKSVAFNILYVPHNTEKIRHGYKLKYNLKRENQVILLMIPDGEK